MDGACWVCFCCQHSPDEDMNVRICWVHAMECVCAQTRPLFILSSERVLGNGVRIHISSKGKMPAMGGSEEGPTMQDSEPNTLPTEPFWLVINYRNFRTTSRDFFPQLLTLRLKQQMRLIYGFFLFEERHTLVYS